MEYRKGDFLIISDLDIRILREEEFDIDLFIPLDMRTLNLYIEELPDYINKRFQFPQVRNLIVRFSTMKDEQYCTIHLLKNIDLKSAVINFEMEYKDYYIRLEEKDYYNNMYLKKKEI